MFTIAGGTGAVGKSLVADLAGKGHDVRVLTRDPKNAALGSTLPNVEFVGVDFDDIKSFEAAFKGSDTAFLSTGTSDRQVRDEILMIDASTNVGVPYLVNLSVGGSDQGIHNNVLEWHTEIDKHLKTRDVASTLIRPATYMDTILGVATNFVMAGAWGGNAGVGRVALTDTRDVAAVAAGILIDGPKRHAGKIYDISGPDALTMDEIALLLTGDLGKPIVYHHRTAADQAALLLSVGVPQLLVEVLAGLDDLTRDGLFQRPSAGFREVTGASPRSVSAWIKENYAKFAPAAAS